MLSRLIEYVLSLENPDRGALAGHGFSQIRVPSFAPNSILRTTIVPTFSVHMLLTFRLLFGWEMNPSTFSFSVDFGGKSQGVGVLSQTIIREGLWTYMPITQAQPLFLMFQNLTALNQYLEFDMEYAEISSLDDYLRVRTALNDLAQIGAHEYRDESLRLMRKIAGEP